MQWADLIPNVGERATFIGQTGSGKTTLLTSVLAEIYGRQQIIIIDSKHDDAFNGLDARYCYTYKELGKVKKSDKLVIYRPQDAEAVDMDLYDAIFQWVYTRRNTAIAIDEITQCVPHTGYGIGFTNLMTRGRIRKCTVLVGTQRPVYAPRLIFSEAQKFWVFNVVDKRDRQTVAGFTDERLSEKVPDTHGFWFVDIPRHIVEYIPTLDAVE